MPVWDVYVGTFTKEFEWLTGLPSEGIERYRFDDRMLCARRGEPPLRRQVVHDGQLAYEYKHLMRKLWLRDRARWRRERWSTPTCHPSFRVVPGGIMGVTAAVAGR